MSGKFKKVYLPDKNITLEFPENTPNELITEIVKRDWDKLPDKRPDLGTWLGHKLAGGYETAVSPEWSLKQTAKEAGKLAVEALAYGTSLGRAITFGIPFAAQAASGIAAIPIGLFAAVAEPSKERGGRDRFTAGLETAGKVIEGSKELVSKIPVIGKPISPIGKTVQKAFGFVLEAIEKAIGAGQKLIGEYERIGAESLREAAAELSFYALCGILGAKGGKALTTTKNAIINKYFPNKKPVLDMPTEIYQQKYSSFQDFITRNNLDISTPETRSFAVKAYNDVLTVQRAAAKEAAKQAKKAMTDTELKQAAEAVKNNRMTLDDWRDLQEFKKREYVYDMFEEAIKKSNLTKEEIKAIKQELIDELNFRPQEKPQEPVKRARVKETPQERKARLEQERLKDIREELQRQADEARDRQIKEKRIRQLEEIDRLIEQKYKSTAQTTPVDTGKSIKYRFSPDTRAGEFYEHLIGSGFTKERAEQITNTIYPEAPKIEVVSGYRIKERIKEFEVKEPSKPIEPSIPPKPSEPPTPTSPTSFTTPTPSTTPETKPVKPEVSKGVKVESTLSKPSEPPKVELDKISEPEPLEKQRTKKQKPSETDKKIQETKASDYTENELKELQTFKEPINRTNYIDSLSRTSSPTIEDIQKVELKKTGKKSKLRDFTDIINNEKGELILGYRSVESVLQDLGVIFKELPEPLEFFKGIKGDIRKKIMLNDTIARIFPQVREHMDILDQIERLPNKYKFEEYKSLQPFFSLKNPEKVYKFIEELRKEGKTRSKHPITDELLDAKGFTEAEKNAIKSFDNFTHRAMDYYIRRTLLNHARLDGGYEKPINYFEAKQLVSYLEQIGEDPHIIKQAKAIARIHQKVDAYADKYYFPASRYGKYFILAKAEDGKTAYLAHTDNKKEIPGIVKKLKQEHPEWEISAGENYKPKMELAYELPPHILPILKSAIEDLHKAGALTITGKDLMVELERMSAKWKGSFAVHLLEADLIEGWEKNLKKSIADYTHRMVKNYAYSEYIPEFRKALTKLDAYNDAPLIEILKKNLDDITSSQYKFKSVNKFMFFYYLSGNFKSALINLTQPVAITFPWTTKYVSTKEATQMFSKAYKDAINYRSKRYGKLDPELKTIMDELVEREILIAQGIKEMMGYKDSISGLRTIPQTAFEYLSIPFKEAEIINRYHAASVFFQIGKKKGLKGEELMKFIEREGLNMTQFDYSTMGLPQIARGSLRPLFIFRLYAINWLSRARQLLREGEYKTFVMLLGSHLLLGGIAGVPMAMELLKAIHWAYNKLADRDEAFEVDMKSLAKKISSEYGDNLANYIQYGLPAFAGLTISGSINPVEISTLDVQHPVYGLIKTVTGVAPDIAVRAQRAYSIWKKHSNAYRAVETMMPEFVRNILVAYRWYDEKGARMANGELIFTPNLFNIVLKSLGFNPVEYINMLSRQEVIRNLLEEHKLKTTSINERLGLALARGDMKTFTNILNAVITQNIKNIEQGKPVINIDDNAIRLHMMKILAPEVYKMSRIPKELHEQVREIEEAYEED